MPASAKRDLDALIERYLAGDLSFVAFQRAYSSRFIDDNACVEFSVEEVDHYGAVHEKAEWTSQSPNAEDRSYGWIDPAEFKWWLGVHELHKPSS